MDGRREGGRGKVRSRLDSIASYRFVFSTKYGMYEPRCGIDNLLMSWGHDEYLYRVLVHNDCKLPDKALAMIRYHSFYPWHAGGDYMHFCTSKDMEMLKWIVEFK